MNPTDFWLAMEETSCDKLFELAIHTVTQEPQSATCERLFSAFGNFKSKMRNRLSTTKMHYLAQVKRNVQLKGEQETIIRNKGKSSRILSPDERPKINEEQRGPCLRNDDNTFKNADDENEEEDGDSEETQIGTTKR